MSIVWRILDNASPSNRQSMRQRDGWRPAPKRAIALPMRYTIGLATTFHDPALAIIGPDGAVLFAEATERYLQYKRAPNCEPDSAPRMEGLLKRYIPRDAEVTIATSWGEDFTGFLDQMARAGSFTLDALLKLSPELNRSLVPERTERALIASLHLGQQRAGMGVLLGLDRAYGKANVTGLKRYGHHLSHAAYACWSSPFDNAACLVVDGMGETGASAIFALENGKLREVKRHRAANRSASISGSSPISPASTRPRARNGRSWGSPPTARPIPN